MKRTIATLSAALLLAGLLVPAAVVAQKGDDKLIDVPIGHFRGHDYKWVTEPMTWPDARDYCEDDGGYLVTITSAAENQYVWARRPGFGGWSGSWLGASDTATEGTFVWVTGEDFTYENWAPDDPNNYGGGPGLGEDYVAFHGLFAEKPRLPGVWIDWQYEDDGSESRLPFTCEYE
jgi:hypothetical protein